MPLDFCIILHAFDFFENHAHLAINNFPQVCIHFVHFSHVLSRIHIWQHTPVKQNDTIVSCKDSLDFILTKFL